MCGEVRCSTRTHLFDIDRFLTERRSALFHTYLPFRHWPLFSRNDIFCGLIISEFLYSHVLNYIESRCRLGSCRLLDFWEPYSSKILAVVCIVVQGVQGFALLKKHTESENTEIADRDVEVPSTQTICPPVFSCPNYGIPCVQISKNPSKDTHQTSIRPSCCFERGRTEGSSFYDVHDHFSAFITLARAWTVFFRKSPGTTSSMCSPIVAIPRETSAR